MNFKLSLVVAKKEVFGEFQSSSIYIFSAIFSLVIGALFYNNLLMTKEFTNRTIIDSVLAPTFSGINFLLMFFAPLITMGTFVKEKRDGTFNLLMLSKLSSMDIFLGKFLASIIRAIFIVLPTIVFPIILSFSGFDDLGIVLTNYLSIFFLTSCYLLVGMLSSLVSRSYITSIVLSFGIIFSILMLYTTGSVVTNDIVSQMLRNLSFGQHVLYFSRGAIALQDIIYFLSFNVYFGYLINRIIGLKK